MELLERFRWNAEHFGDRVAYETSAPVRESITYRELDRRSDKAALDLAGRAPGNASIMVFGSVQVDMVVLFMACIKLGRPYIPVNSGLPLLRIQDIGEQSGSALLAAVEAFTYLQENLPPVYHYQAETNGGNAVSVNLDGSENLEDTAYILFTSGSTGRPKGVEISYGALDAFTYWMAGRIQDFLPHCPHFLGHAPFSFDLSLMGLYPILLLGRTYVSFAREATQYFSLLYPVFQDYPGAALIATPSFGDMCLLDRSFSSPGGYSLSGFLFCGETLQPSTVRELFLRFPGGKVFNSYGPTESTVAVSLMEINGDLVKEKVLPVGYVKPGISLRIVDEEGHEIPEGEQGQIILYGDTVGKGYLGDPDLTREKFFWDAEQNVRAYRTGDWGAVKDGLLYCYGRMDDQIKLHGYRVELGDVAHNILELPYVRQVQVLVKAPDTGLPYLYALVVPEEGAECTLGQIRGDLGQKVPEYMIPRRFEFVSSIPLGRHGKASREIRLEMES